jgi:hypothetical protein
MFGSRKCLVLVTEYCKYLKRSIFCICDLNYVSDTPKFYSEKKENIMKFNTRVNQYIVGATLALVASLPVSAASISAQASSNSIEVGEVATADLVLNLAPGEAASVFEGTFGISGLGTVTSASINATGPSWPNAASNIKDGNALFSLTSENDSDPTRLLATVSFTGLSAGTTNVTFDSKTFAAFDIPSFPFSQNLFLGNTSGQILTSITVVPEPSVVAMLMLGLVTLILKAGGKKGNFLSRTKFTI